MKALKPLFLLIFFSAFMNSRGADLPEKHLKFETLTINDGLSQGMINCILQDRYGFMWFATKDGLNRYDGYRFVVYKHDPSDPTTIIDNFIQTLFEDSKGRLWIGTATRGLELFEREKESFTHFHDEDGKNSPLADDHVMAITEDKQGLLWISTHKNLTTLRIHENAVEKKDKYEFRHVSPYRFTVYVAANGDKYLSGNGKVYFLSHTSDGITLRDTIALSTLYQSGNPSRDRSPQQFYESPEEGEMYYFFSDRVTRQNKDSGRMEILSSALYHKGFYVSPPVRDASGKFWLCELDWLLLFDPATRQMSRVMPFDPNVNKFLNNVNYIYKDRSGILWIGTKGYGIVKHNSSTEKFNRTDNSTILFMSGTADGKILVCRSGRYVDLFDPETAAYTGLIPSPEVYSIPESNPGGLADAALESEPGIFWICKSRIIYFDSLRKVVKEYRKGTGDNFPMFKTRSNEIWCGGADAFCRYDKIKDTFVEYPFPVSAGDMPYRFLEAIYEDAEGIFWLGTTAGLFRFDPVRETWKQFKNTPGDSSSLSLDVIFTLCPDPVSANHLWIGTNGGGLNRFDMKTGKAERYSEKNGLPNNVVYGILNDDKGFLWLSTNKGLAEFDPAKKSFRRFEQRDGLQGDEFNRHAYCKLKNGTLCFGGVNGFNYFNPQDLNLNPAIPEVQITDLKLSNQSVSFGSKESPLQKPVYLTESIRLRYRDNMVSFEFASLDFAAPSKNLYRYRLEGFDEEWIAAGTHHTATYTNLDPGKYTFRVHGSNSDEVWNTKGASIGLTILPPFYMTWWFRGLVIALIAAGVFSWNRYRLGQALKLQAVRDRIARDLHDEIGSTLQSISLYSEVAGKVVREKAPEAKEMLSQISESTTNMMEAMSDIVWTINTRNDRFDNLVNRMRAFAVEALEARNCKVHFDTSENIGSYHLGMEQRKNLFLIFKESINNAAKHGACANVWVDCKIAHRSLHLKIRDDGKGFTLRNGIGTRNEAGGNGLFNIRKRASELKGQIRIVSEPGKGTTVDLKFKL